VALSVDSPIKLLLDDDDARAVLEQHMPGFVEQAGMGAALGLSLTQMAVFAPDQITTETLQAIADDLRAIVEE
jgi:hypothetical protein